MARKIIPRETVIAVGECYECGRDVHVKTDKNGRAYHVCRWPDAITHNACNDQRRYGRGSTDTMIKNFQRESKADASESTQSDVPESDTGNGTSDDFLGG